MDFDNIKFETKRLSISTIQKQDYNDIYRDITPSLTRYLSWNPSETFEDFVQIAEDWQQNMRTQKERLVLTIRDKTDQRFLGLTGIHECLTVLPALGIWISESEHHQGLGREAVHGLIAWASQHHIELNISGFLYPVALENPPSRKIAEAANGTLISYQQEKKFMTLTYYIPLKRDPIDSTTSYFI